MSSRTDMTVLDQTSHFYILDFDGTITTKDSTVTVLNFGKSYQNAQGYDFTAVLEEIVEGYGQDYASHIANYQPSKKDRNTLEEEIAYQRSLQDVEMKSFDRVGKSGIFRGISEADWEEAGRNAVRVGDVLVRTGFKSFVEAIEASGSKWGIVSVNLSRSFIKGVLQQSLSHENVEIPILANFPDKDGIMRGPGLAATGSKYGTISATSDTKLFAMQHLLKMSELSTSIQVVYFGDSDTDIECLTNDHVLGMVMSDDEDSSLMRTLKNINHQAGSKEPVHWAQDFVDIMRRLLEIRNN